MTRRHLRIYIAGPIQGPDLLHSLANIDAGQAYTAKLFQLGFSPFPVFCDAAFIQRVRPVPPIGDVYAYSCAWLRAADAMFVMPGSESSRGVAQEVAEAGKAGVPVFHDLVDLCAWADAQSVNPSFEAEKALAEGDD
jgi:hypothetical protein